MPRASSVPIHLHFFVSIFLCGFLTGGFADLAAQTGDESALDAELEAVTKQARETSEAESLERLTATANATAPQLRLIDISLIADFAFGGGDRTEPELANLQAHNHDPKLKGGQVTGVELSLGGAIDPFFYGEAHILASEGAVELEEAFLTTQALPWGFQIEMGYFLTEFGLHNPTHQHSWAWNDAPVITTRLFGAEGMRASGLRVSNLLPLPWYSEFHLGAQRAVGETMHGFLHTPSGGGGHSHGGSDEQEELGGRPTSEDRVTKSSGELAYLARWENSFDLGKTVTTKFGFSGVGGPNATGDRGRTNIYGGDLLIKWRPVRNYRGFPYVTFQAEGMRRDFVVDNRVDIGELENFASIRDNTLYDPYDERERFGAEDLSEIRAETIDTADYGDLTDVLDVLNGRKSYEELDEDERKMYIHTVRNLLHKTETLHDWGFYAQLMVGFVRNWSAGVRYDYASGAGESWVDGGDWVGDTDIYGRDRDPQRDTRRRYSPIVQYQPSEFSRFRLQYNRDYADHLRRRRTYVTPLSAVLPGAPDIPYEFEWANSGKDAWSLWFTAEFLIGAHPAHKF